MIIPDSRVLIKNAYKCFFIKIINNATIYLLTSSNNQISEFWIPNIYNEI